jgi:hypothetical protein
VDECEAEFKLHPYEDGHAAYLTCGLEAGHPEHHWDATSELLWSTWTRDQENAMQRLHTGVPAARLLREVFLLADGTDLVGEIGLMHEEGDPA